MTAQDTFVVALLAMLLSSHVGAAQQLSADPASDAALSEREAAVLREQNLARSDPPAYARYLREWRDHYDGRYIKFAGRAPILTTEGVRAVDEAIAWLENTKPVPRLRQSAGMSRAARDHVDDSGPKGWMGHEGSDGSEPGDRVNRYGKWYRRVGENITYGGVDARELIVRLIVDDGVRGRGHRENLFREEYRVTGIAFGRHSEYRTMCVIDYAVDYEEK